MVNFELADFIQVYSAIYFYLMLRVNVLKKTAKI